jgi:hypothetical protein
MNKFNMQDFKRIRKIESSNKIDLEMKFISDIPIFIINIDRKNEIIPQIVDFFGKSTVFRIIKAQFINNAIEFGTDKGRIDEHDFRWIADSSGYDVWGVEKQATKQGLKKADVFCGIPYKLFSEGGSQFDSSGLDIPNDRAAILIYNSEKVQEIENPEEMGNVTDGYAFRDVANKQEALLGIIKFRESFLEFEGELHELESIDDKITLLEKEVFQNLNTPDDLKKTPYIALNIITLLYNESIKNTNNVTENSIKHINILKSIADRLKYEIRMINIVDNMTKQVDITYEAFKEGNKRKIEMMQRWPDFVIKTTQSYLLETKLDQKYIDALNQVIKNARKCNTELGIGINTTTKNLQKKIKIDIEDNLSGKE